MAIAAERFADRFDVGAELNCDADHDGAVARIRVSRRIEFVVAQEDFANPAVRIPADRAGVTQAGDFELEALGQAAIRAAGGARS